MVSAAVKRVLFFGGYLGLVMRMQGAKNASVSPEFVVSWVGDVFC